MLDPLYFGKTIISLKIVDSTNNYSTELLKHGFVAEGTVIMAEEQTSGRGQRGNTWRSEPGCNLTCSIIVHPSFIGLSDHFKLTQTVSLAVADALQYLTNDTFQIKWPNDILYNHKKIAGILIETVNNNSKIGSAIIGIGLNVNQVEGLEDFQATSLKCITANDHEIRKVAEVLSFFMEKRYLMLKNGKDKEIRVDYLNHLYGKDEIKRYRSGDNIFSGKILGVSPEGYLEIEREGGDVKKYDLKEISLQR
jgi:BirA family transcriptional regulator, biotin operon repressor / biotin---[acetyl-CoA-carboxylase] ligase